MKVLSISTDRKLFEDDSPVLLRQVEYAKKMQELHVIVFSLRSSGYREKIKNNLYIYPTNSSSKLSYVFDAIRLSKKLIVKEGLNGGSTAVTCQDPFETGIVGYYLKRKFHLPLQLQIHTDFLSSYFKNNFLNRLRIFIAKFLIPRVNSLRVVSSVISDSIIKQFPNLKLKINILSIFVDTETLQNTTSNINVTNQFSPTFKNNIFMYSRLTKEKRFDIALKVIKNVSNEIEDLGLIIFGDGPEEENIRKMTKDLGIEDKVMFKGWANNTDILSVFKNNGVFLLTSDHEGYGMTLIEAGASGCPIVTTKVGIARTDLFKDRVNSFVCSAGDVDCLSKSIMDLMTNEEKRKLFKIRMQDSIKEIAISKDNYVRKYVSLLEELIKNA